MRRLHDVRKVLVFGLRKVQALFEAEKAGEYGTGFSVVCLVIGFLLGGMFETSLRQSLLIYKSDFSEILQSPIAVVFLVLTCFLVVRSFRRP